MSLCACGCGRRIVNLSGRRKLHPACKASKRHQQQTAYHMDRYIEAKFQAQRKGRAA